MVELKTAPPPGPGHNSGAAEPDGTIAADRLRSIVERWERLDEEVKALRSGQRDIMVEAKGAGYNPKVIRTLIKRRAKDPAELEEEDNLLDLYAHALNMI